MTAKIHGRSASDSLATAPDEGATPIEAFALQAELVDAEREIVCARARSLLAARARRLGADPHEGAAELDALEQYVDARAAASAAAGIEFPIAWLQTRLGLTPDEMRVLWVLIAHEMFDEARDLVRKLNTEATSDPTTATLRLVAFGDRPVKEASEIWKPDRPLVGGGLIERTDNDRSAALHRQTWKAAPRVIALAYGDTSADPALVDIGEVVQPATIEIGIGGAGIEAAPDALDMIIAAIQDRERARGAVLVHGPRGIGRRSLLRIAAAHMGYELLEFDAAQLDRDPDRARHQIEALARDCRLFRRVPLLRNLEALLQAPRRASEDNAAPPTISEHLPLLARRLRGLLVLGTTTATLPPALFPAPAIVELAGITAEQRVRLWRRALPVLPEATAERLATTFPVTPAVLATTATVASAQVGNGDSPERAERAVRLGLRAVLDGRIGDLAMALDTDEISAELVLPREQVKQLTEMIIRITHQRTVYETWQMADRLRRGLAVSALFYGPPGTGKTMAAGIVAREISANMYIVDTSRIISKWLGETEKNLGNLFDAAEEAHAALLFDEADALFGKRTEVKTSNDRFANAETNYLLTRLERFRGICILTTNNATGIDEAFMRRIAFHVEFPMPEENERAALWRSLLVPSIPIEGRIDFVALGRRYEMSGGYIAKAVTRAAFLAAHAGTGVTFEHLEVAAEAEYHAMGRIAASSTL